MKVYICSLLVLILCILQSYQFKSSNYQESINLSSLPIGLFNRDIQRQSSPEQTASQQEKEELEGQNLLKGLPGSDYNEYKGTQRNLKKTDAPNKNTHSSSTGPVKSSNNDQTQQSLDSQGELIVIIVVSIVGTTVIIIAVYCIKKHYCDNPNPEVQNIQRLSTNDWNIVKSENDSPSERQQFNLHNLKGNGSKGNESNGRKHIAIFVGETASGKSSLLNKLFNARQSVGMGDCTQQIQKINWSGKFQIYDSPGIINDTMKSDTEEWTKFLQYHLVFVVYDYSLVRIDKFVKFMIENKREGLYFVRSKCDNFDNAGLALGLDKELAKDRQKLKEWGCNRVNILCSSTKKGDFDNQKIKKIVS